MRSFPIVIVLVLAGCRCYGQNSAEFKGCTDKAQTQFERDKCASDEAARADLGAQHPIQQLLVKIAETHSLSPSWVEAETAKVALQGRVHRGGLSRSGQVQLAYGTEYPMDVDLLSAKAGYANI